MWETTEVLDNKESLRQVGSQGLKCLSEEMSFKYTMQDGERIKYPQQ